MKRLIVVLALSLLSFPSFAIVITHGASGGVFTVNNGATTVGFSAFDRAEFTFAAVFADTITIGNTGLSAFAHNHSAVRFAEVDVFDGANWINVFSSSIPAGSILLSNLFAAPIGFAGLSISGLRLDVDFPVVFAYHSVSAAMTYTTSAVSVPEPGTLALLGLGLAGIGLARRRKKV